MKDKKGFEETIKWYNNNASAYAQIIKNKIRPDTYKFISLLPQNGSVLDVGCAAGRDSRLFKDKGFQVVGVDLSVGLLRIARKENPDISFFKANLLSLPFENNYFNGVFAQACLHHLQSLKEVKQALLEFKRVLKKNGLLFITVKAKKGKEKFKLLKDKYSFNSSRFFQLFSQKELRDLLQETGFIILKLEKRLGRQTDSRPDIDWITCLAKK